MMPEKYFCWTKKTH